MIWLLKNCKMVTTDSGGLQKESYFFKKPCVIYRTETEWVELVDTGWNFLAPPIDGIDIAAAMKNALGSCGMEIELYGQGDAAEKIIRKINGG